MWADWLYGSKQIESNLIEFDAESNRIVFLFGDRPSLIQNGQIKSNPEGIYVCNVNKTSYVKTNSY